MLIKVPGYEVGGLLGKGAHGTVWAGRKTSTGAEVALKRVALKVGEDVGKAIKTEAALLSALAHPSLISLREWVVCDDSVVLVLELAAGGSLANLLDRRGRLTPPEVAASLSPVAAALAYAHDEGVIHSDVSAANVLFTEAGQPKLADLGVARLRCSNSFDETIFGTPAYLDPAVAAGGPFGAASDVFSIAAVALHALTGRGPWHREGETNDVSSVLARAATGALPDLPKRLQSMQPVPPAMAAAVLRGLERDPHRRGSAAEFALDLRASVADGPVVLSAGRIVARGGGGGRHCADQPQTAAAEHSRPGFQRPIFMRDGVVPADLTHALRSETSSPEAATERRGRLSRAKVRPVLFGFANRVRRAVAPRSKLLWSISFAVVLAAGVAGLLLVTEGPSRSSAAGAEPAKTTASATQTSARPATTLVEQAAGLLSSLDQRRQAAYAERKADLLSEVYLDPSLLARDRAQLTERVPLGCALAGLSTSYSQLQLISSTSKRFDLRVTATLSASEVHCPQGPTVRLSAIGPTTLLITLLSDDAGRFKIASQRVSA